MPPLLLDDDEAVAVALGLRTAANGTVMGMEEASVRALVKLEQVLPPRLRRRVSALNSSIVPLSGAGPTVNSTILSTIAGACRDHERLRFPYRGRDGELTTRDVEPYRLVHTDRRWYLVGWDVDRGNWRTFRVDRIEPTPKIGLRFRPRTPPDGGFATYVSHSLSNAPYPHCAEVILHVAAETAGERVPPAAGMIEAIDERTCILRTGYHSPDVACMYLALMGIDFEVRNPPELIEQLRLLRDRLNRATL